MKNFLNLNCTDICPPPLLHPLANIFGKNRGPEIKIRPGPPNFSDRSDRPWLYPL
jgi:hypothetical protein